MRIASRIRIPRISDRLKLRLAVAVSLGALAVLLAPILLPLWPILLNAIPLSSFLFDPEGSVAGLYLFAFILCVPFLAELLTGRISNFLVRVLDWQRDLEEALSAVSGRLDCISRELDEMRQRAVQLSLVSALATRSRH